MNLLFNEKIITEEEISEIVNKYISESQNITLTENHLQIISQFLELADAFNRYKLSQIKHNQTKISLRHQLKLLKENDVDEIKLLKEFIHDFKTQIDTTFEEYIQKALFYDFPVENFLLINNAIFCNKMNILKVASDIYLLFDTSNKNKLFGAFLQYESSSRSLDNQDENLDDNEYLSQLQTVRVVQKRSMGAGYKKIISLIEESYSSNKRYLNELLQNADDCTYNNTKSSPTFILKGNHKKITIDYNEDGFKKQNVRAITSIGESTKKQIFEESSNSTIGEKGIGFKSVFKIANSVTIKSGNFHFKLKSDAPTIPESQKKSEKNGNLSYLGTQMTFDLKDNFDGFIKDEKELISLCLCLRKLKHIQIFENNLTISDSDTYRTINLNGKEYVFQKFVYNYNIKAASSETFKIISKSKYVEPIQSIIFYVPPLEMDCYLYNGLPTKIKINSPIVIDAPFELTTSREYVLEESPWNDIITQKVCDSYIEFLNDYKITINNRIKILDFIPFNKDEGNSIELFSGYLHPEKNLGELINDSSIFPCFNEDKWFAPCNEDGDFHAFYLHNIEKFALKTFGYTYNEISLYSYSNVIDCNENEWKNYHSTLKIFDVKQRTFEGTFTHLNEKYKCLDKSHLKNADFSRMLYEFLDIPSEITDDFKAYLKSLEIIPIKTINGTEFISSNSNIFYAPENDPVFSGDTYSILDEEKMKKETFDKLFFRIQEFNDSKKFESYMQKIEMWLNESESSLETYAEKFLEEYHNNKENLIRALDELDEKSNVPMKMKNKTIKIDNKYVHKYDFEFEGYLSALIVDDDYQDFASDLDYLDIAQLDVSDLKDVQLSEDDLNEFFTISFFASSDIYSSLLLSHLSNDLISKYFFKIYSKAYFNPSDLKNLSCDIYVENLNEHREVITKISCTCSSISFDISKFKRVDFDRDSVVDEIKEQIKNKDHPNTEIAVNSLENIWYCNNLNDYCLCNFNDQVQGKTLLLPINDKTESDVVGRLKQFLKKCYNISISLDREIHVYTRNGFKRITNNYSDQDVTQLITRYSRHVFDKNEDLKDFLAKPMHVNNKVVGGYAKTCPLCSSKIHTELTGWRIVPLTQSFHSDTVKFKLICCPNCHDIFSYSKDYWIDIEKWNKESILSLRVEINGYQWEPKSFKVKLAHKVLIKLLNKDSKWGEPE